MVYWDRSRLHRIALVPHLTGRFLIVKIHGRLNSGRGNHCHCIAYRFHEFWQQSYFIIGKLFKDVSLNRQFIKRSSDTDSYPDEFRIDEVVYYGD